MAVINKDTPVKEIIFLLARIRGSLDVLEDLYVSGRDPNEPIGEEAAREIGLIFPEDTRSYGRTWTSACG